MALASACGLTVILKTVSITVYLLGLALICTPPAAELYYVLFDAIISGKNPEHGREGYYFIENGEYKLKQVCDAIAKSLYALGKADKDEPVDLSPEEREKYQWVCCLFIQSSGTVLTFAES